MAPKSGFWTQKEVFGGDAAGSRDSTELLVTRVNPQKALLGGLAVGRRSWTGLGFQWQTW